MSRDIKSDIAPRSARHAHELRLRSDADDAFEALILALEALRPNSLDYLLSGNYDAALAVHEDQMAALEAAWRAGR